MIEINHSKCSKCEKCVNICHTQCLSTREGGITINHKQCSTCCQCIAICPHSAITWSGTASKKVVTENLPTYGSLLEFLKARRTIRRFRPEPPAEEEILKICKSAKLSPTNVYDINLYVVRDRKLIRELELLCMSYIKRVYRILYNSVLFKIMKRLTPAVNEIDKLKTERTLKRNSLFYNAPVIILVTADPRIPHSEASCQYALYNMILVAQSLGIGTCISGAARIVLSRNKKAGRILNLSSNKAILGVLLLGYPAVKFPNSVEGNYPEIIWG